MIFLRPYTSIKFSSYRVYRNDRPYYQGTAVPVKGIHHHFFLPTPLLCAKGMVFQLANSDGPLVISSIYVPIRTCLEILSKFDLETLHTSSNLPVLIAGDFNSHHKNIWSFRTTSASGKLITHLLGSYTLQLHLPAKSHGISVHTAHPPPLLTLTSPEKNCSHVDVAILDGTTLTLLHCYAVKLYFDPYVP